MEQTDVHAVNPQDHSSTLTLVLIGIVIIVALGLVVGVVGYLALTTGTNETANNETATNSTNNQQNLQSYITVETPSENAQLNGEVLVTGTASGDITLLKVELFDMHDNRLALGNVPISVMDGAENTWQTQLDVITSPLSAEGRIVVTSENPNFTKQIDIVFESYTDSPDYLTIFAPLKNQVILSDNITVHGEAKGLFEGTLNLRLIDEVGNTVYEDAITIPDQEEAFKEFTYELSIPGLSSAIGEIGIWEFYYVSAIDGQDVILQTIPVRFL
ncbi:hypothetical protein DOJK_01294 [Patescibacteria group bacterium]|mgnify:CR=1 FL=1|jgi:hypothetical protein|nr:hypothetical protein [Candidatus Dojkabacteria bacterium]CAG1021866.1 hypothetical protein DOJK_01294 [Patescibacteria group bacterium]